MANKNSKISKLISSTLLAAIMLSPATFSSSIASELQTSSYLQEAALMHDHEEEKIKADLEVEVEAPKSKGQKLIDKLYKQLSASQSNYEHVSGSVDRTKDRLVKTEEQLRTLEGQLQILDEEIAHTTTTVHNVRYQISSAEVELRELFEEIELRALELENQRRILNDYLQLIYFQQNVFYDGQPQSIKPIKFLLADSSVSTSLREEMYLQLMEEQGTEIFETLADIAESLKEEKKLYESKKKKLEALNTRLTLDLQILQEQEDAKQQLFDETKGQEEIFKQLLIYARIEQRQISEEIKELSKNIGFINSKLSTLSDAEIITLEGEINDFIKKNYLMGITAGDVTSLPQFSWPVLPTQGISAYFKDGGYHAHFGIPHFAVDIPVPQGTPVHAPAPGVVSSVVDQGKGYSYIILSHQDGFTTLYGHMYAMNVNIGDIVHRGDIIGLSGGAPGTKGAGLLTTGPHLHFEVFKDGEHVDPLFFLPLRHLGKEKLNDKYHELYELEQEKMKEFAASGASELVDSLSRQIDEEIALELEEELGLSPAE